VNRSRRIAGGAPSWQLFGEGDKGFGSTALPHLDYEPPPASGSKAQSCRRRPTTRATSPPPTPGRMFWKSKICYKTDRQRHDRRVRRQQEGLAPGEVAKPIDCGYMPEKGAELFLREPVRSSARM